MGNRQPIPVFLEVVAQIVAASIFRGHLEPKILEMEPASPGSGIMFDIKIKQTDK